MLATLTEADMRFAAALDELLVAFHQETMPDTMSGLRLKYNQAANARMLVIRNWVVPTLDASSRPGARRLASDLKRDILAFNQSYAEHIAHWTMDAIRTDWHRYRQHSAKLLSARKQCSRAEQRKLETELPHVLADVGIRESSLPSGSIMFVCPSLFR